MPVLFAVIPVYDEPHTLALCVANVMAVQLPAQWSLQVIVVDDASGAATATVAREISQLYKGSNSQFELLTHAVNLGKGAALRTGFERALQQASDMDAVITQDGDLEYDPNDYPTLLNALSSEPLAAVFGNRWGHALGGGVWRIFHTGVNRLLTFLSNQITGFDISDMETGYKLFRAPLLRKILPMLTEDRFGIEPQMTAALARAGARLSEVPIHYAPRDREGGKKIGPLDGLRALWVIARERVQRDSESINAQKLNENKQIGVSANTTQFTTKQSDAQAATNSQANISNNSSGKSLGNSAGKLILQGAGFALGVALIAWCVWGAAKDPAGWQRLREASSMSLIGLLLCSFGSIIVSGLTFWIAARPVQTLRVQDQQWINALASMLNYAPVRIGMFVRAAYTMKVDHFRAVELVAWFASVAFTFVVALAAITAGTVAWIQFGAWSFFSNLDPHRLAWWIQRALVRHAHHGAKTRQRSRTTHHQSLRLVGLHCASHSGFIFCHRARAACHTNPWITAEFGANFPGVHGVLCGVVKSTWSTWFSRSCCGVHSRSSFHWRTRWYGK